MRERYCRVCRGWHDISVDWPVSCLGHFGQTRPSATIHVISDSMDMLKHPATGHMTDSKSVFRGHTKASGCIEVGNEPMKPQKPQHKLENPRVSIARALERY